MKRKDITDIWILKQYNLYNIRSKRGCLGIRFYDWLLNKEPNCPPMVMFRALERCIANGYMDYGISVATAFITDKGVDKLKDYFIGTCFEITEEQVFIKTNEP